MMTIWTELDWSGMESIEHRNMDIIMEELGVMLEVDCMEVDMEEAWKELEVMEGVEYNTHNSPRLEQVPPKISEYTAKQDLQTHSWMVWRGSDMEIAKDVEKPKDEDRVDLEGEDLPDLHGEHVGKELQVGADKKETVMIDNKAYHDGGSWVVDRWRPRENVKDTFTVDNNNIHTIKHQNDKEISVVKLKMTNLITIRIVNSKSKAGGLLSSWTSIAGKRLRDDMGDWWLREEDLIASRRDRWPGWRPTSGTSSSYKENSEHQEMKHQHLWKDLVLTKPYLETAVVKDINIMRGLGEDSVMLEPVDDLIASRRDRWPGWRPTSGTSSSYKENSEHQEMKHQHLWKDLVLTKPYLETAVVKDINIMRGLGEDSVMLEPVDDCRMMDIGLAGTENMEVIVPGNRDMVNIITLWVEDRPVDKETLDNEDNII